MSLEEIGFRLERTQLVYAHAHDLLTGRVTPAGQPRTELVGRAVKEMRAKHPELNAPVTFPALRRVFRREKIFLFRSRISGLGRAMPPFRGIAGIILRTPMPRGELIRTALHELGHVRLHIFDRAFDERRRAEMFAPSPIFTLHDQAEAEADLFRDLILTSH